MTFSKYTLRLGSSCAVWRIEQQAVAKKICFAFLYESGTKLYENIPFAFSLYWPPCHVKFSLSVDKSRKPHATLNHNLIKW